MKRIKVNKVRCVHCGDVIESTWIHDLKTCSCGRVTVDGGHDYIRRGFWECTDYEELSEYEDVIENNKELERK